MKRAGVDVGGTFTDIVTIDDETGAVSECKVPSDPTQLETGIVTGLVRALGGEQRTKELGFIGHGTTVATNVTLERTGPRVAMLCTRGFRDIIEIARLARPGEKLYTLKSVMPEPVVARRDCFEVTERIAADGRIVTALDEQDVEEAVKAISARGIRALAVCLLFSFRNSAHEMRIREIVERIDSSIQVSLSSEVWPEFREYERASTTTLNSYLRPAAWSYLNRLRSVITEMFPAAGLWVMQSNGGLTTPENASGLPVRLVMSGPAGGVVGARYVAQQTGLANLITIDMGGTSFDVSLLRGGEPSLVDKQDVMGLPVKGRSLDILTIGSGGGSIAWADRAGQFRVGPRSAGAFPGPACYGRGGTEPTVTDANLVLGYFEPRVPIAGGDLTLDYDAAYRACESLGSKLGLGAIDVAWGIRRIVNSAMAGAVRAASVRRGHDPRDFALFGFGGAGPLHAVDIATEMGMRDVVIPGVAGCFSAMGIAITDAAYDLVRTESIIVDHDAESHISDTIAELIGAGAQELTDSGIPSTLQEFDLSLDLRYRGQNSTLGVGLCSSADLRDAVTRFHAEHLRQFGYHSPDEEVDLVNIRVRALGRIGRNQPLDTKDVKRHPVKPTSSRHVMVGHGDQVKAAVYDRAVLRQGATFTGPAIVDSSDTTVVIPPNSSAHIDNAGHLRIERESR